MSFYYKADSELTKSQAGLINEILIFLASDKVTFTISGFAGTGKSYVTNYIIKNYLQSKRVCVTAPTHRAVKVIESFTGKKGLTLHALHGLRPNYSLDDFNIDNIKYESIGTIKFGDYDVIFSDEGSMTSESLKKLNEVRAKMYKTKIIYLGDEYQLPPVKEDNISKIFTNVDMKYNLTDIVRQKETNPLLDVFDILREDIDNKSNNFISLIKSKKSNIIGNEGYRTLNLNQTKELMKEVFLSDEFKTNTSYCRYAGYTNEAVSLWNGYIRTILFPTKDLIVTGDLLTAYKTIIDENNAPIIVNSTDYKVISSERRISELGFACYNVTILSHDTNKVSKLSIVDHTDPTFRIYYDILNRLHRTAHYSKGIERSEGFKKYFKFKNTHLSMINFDLADGLNVRGYVTKEIYYGYGLTIHKLQGTTLKNIILDVLDIAYVKMNSKIPRVNSSFQPNAIDLRNRLLYTGITRVENVANLILQ